MSYQEELGKIIDSIRPQFGTLSIYAFQGDGDDEEVVKAFVDVYEGYQKARELTAATYGKPELTLAAGMAGCSPEEQILGEDDYQMEAVYSIASTQGMLPPPMMNLLTEFTMKTNLYFVAAQNL